jgi:hypothetical protein
LAERRQLQKSNSGQIFSKCRQTKARHGSIPGRNETPLLFFEVIISANSSAAPTVRHSENPVTEEDGWIVSKSERISATGESTTGTNTPRV